MNFILENLAIGDCREAVHPPPGISALLCVAQEIDPPVTDLPGHKVPMADMQPIPPEQLREAVEWLRDHIADHGILVYCNAGVGRSPSVVVAYLCCVLGFPFGEAVEYVARRKPYMSILPELVTSIDKVRDALQRN